MQGQMINLNGKTYNRQVEMLRDVEKITWFECGGQTEQEIYNQEVMLELEEAYENILLTIITQLYQLFKNIFIMGTPDAFSQTPEGTLMLDIKTVVVQGKSRPLPTLREWITRYSPIRYVVNTDNLNIYSYHNIDAEKELEELLKKQISHDTNKEN